MSDEVGSSGRWKPSVNPWLIAATVALAAFMEVLDTSIANVALPHIAGDLGASTIREPGCSPAIWFPTQSFCRWAPGLRASSVARISFCYASPSSPRQVFFAVSLQRSRSCLFHAFFVRNVGGSIFIAITGAIVTQPFSLPPGASAGVHAARQSRLRQPGQRAYLLLWRWRQRTRTGLHGTSCYLSATQSAGPLRRLIRTIYRLLCWQWAWWCAP